MTANYKTIILGRDEPDRLIMKFFTMFENSSGCDCESCIRCRKYDNNRTDLFPKFFNKELSNLSESQFLDSRRDSAWVGTDNGRNIIKYLKNDTYNFEDTIEAFLKHTNSISPQSQHGDYPVYILKDGEWYYTEPDTDFMLVKCSEKC